MRKILTVLALLSLFAARAYADGSRSHTFTTVSADSSVKTEGSGIAYHLLTWSKTGTVSTCQIKLQQSVDNISWSDLIAAQTCTSNGQSAVTNVVANYVRMNMTTLSGGGSVAVRWNGYVINPSGGGGAPGGSDTQLQFNDSSAFAGAAQFVWDKTLNKSTLGAALTFPMALGIDSIPGNTDGFIVQKVTQGASHYGVGVFAQATANPRSATGIYGTGIGLGTNGGGTGAQFEGYEAPAMGGTTNQFGAGVFAAHGNYGLGTLATAAAFRGFPTNLSTGTITDAISFFGQPASNPGAGTITNAYNFYADTNTAATNNFAYYSTGGSNRFLSPGATAATCQGLLCLGGDGYGDLDGFGTHALLTIQTDANGPYGLMFKNTAAMDYANTLYTFLMGSTGIVQSYGTVDNLTYTGFTIDPNTNTFNFDGGGGGTTYPMAPRYGTLTNCSDSAGDAACGSASAGTVVIDATDTNTVVSTTAVTADSEIKIQEDSSLGARLGVTCNTTIARIYVVTARTAGTSFTITASAAPVANPACLSYFLVN